MSDVGPRYYQLSDACTRADLRSALVEEMGLSDDGLQSVDRDFLDSFDWRVCRAGYLLETESADGGVLLTRRSLDPAVDSSPPLTLVLPQRPRTAADINAASLGDWLGKVLDLRALLPVARLKSRVQRYSLRDADGKQRVRVSVQRDRLPHGNSHTELPRRLLIEPLRGYEADAAQLLADLRRHCKLKPLHTDPFYLAVAAAGRTVGDYDQKVDFRLNPNQRTDDAARAILLALLEAMERNEAGINALTDTEFLHDFRVAVRRSRSLVGQVKGVFARDELAHFKVELGWLGQITGPSRDLDVYLLDFDKLGSGLPEYQRPHLAPLKVFLTAHHGEAYAELAKALRGKRYKTFRRAWRTFLSTAPAAISPLPNAMRPVQHVADERIWGLYRLALREGGAITPESPNDDLHELRKTCKKLRYLMEFFRSLYPAEKLDENIRALKKLQDFLGLFQDLEVQSAKLHEFEQQMRDADQLPAQTATAIEALVAHMLAEQAALRGRFESLFASFAAADNQDHYRALFAPRSD